MSISSVCVYCGSASQVPQTYKNLATNVGTQLAQNKMKVIYGGGHVGLMGIVADSALAAGGEVIGIIPEHIRAKEVQHNHLTELHVVPDMHTRKRMMAERSDAFLVLPGGLGTLDECFEILTWRKLNLHNKPIIFVNHEDFWDPLFALFEKTLADGFSQPPDRNLFKTVDNVPDMMALLLESNAPKTATLTSRM